MWLASALEKKTLEKNSKESHNEGLFLDLCFEISPFVQVDEDLLLIPLHGLDRYWQLTQIHTLSPEHPLIKKLLSFSKKWPEQKFVFAPTSAWARWIFRSQNLEASPSANNIFYFSFHNISAQLLDFSPIENISFFLTDLITENSERKRELNFLCESARELGISTVGQFLKILAESPDRITLFELRFGPLVRVLLQRALQNSDNWPGKPYVPPQNFKFKIDLSFEKLTSSEKSEDIHIRSLELFNEWEERLRCRRSLIRGFDIEIFSSRSRRKAFFPIRLSRPTREAKSFFKLFQEAWSGCKQDPKSFGLGLEDEIDCLVFKTLNLENDKEYQLNLFNPRSEEISEGWQTLIARMRLRAPQKRDLKIGSYTPQPSFFPERALIWSEWKSEEENFPQVARPSLRPSYLLSPPQEFRSADLKTFENFVEIIEKQGNLESLERISNPWALPLPEERTYARMGKQWVFWDHVRNASFVQGYF